MEEKILEKLKLKISISEIKKESKLDMNRKRVFINKKIGIVACACFILTTGVVFAKDIEQYFKGLFTNTNHAIEDAVENGYLQKEEASYVYDNNVGIKVDSLVLDELHLNISFDFKVEDENIKSIRFKDFIISSDCGRNVYESEIQPKENIDDIYLANSVEWMGLAQRIDEKTLIDSILFGLRENDKQINELGFNITKLHVIYQDDTTKEIEGNWKFTVAIKDEMRKKSSITYVLKEENEYVENCTGILSATGFQMDLKLKEPFDPFDYVFNLYKENQDAGVFLVKINENIYMPEWIETDNINYRLPYKDFGTYSGDFEKIEIYLQPWDSTMFLEKE